MAAAMGAVKVGSGFDPAVTCGLMINPGAVDNIHSLVRAAVGDGARTALGGAAIHRPGFFYQPTVLSGVSHDSPVARREIFGPVAPVIAFTDIDDMIAAANDTEMGLTGYVYTSDLAKGLRVSERIQAGMFGLNRGAVSYPAAPFGGMKQSGLGREGATEGTYSRLSPPRPPPASSLLPPVAPLGPAPQPPASRLVRTALDDRIPISCDVPSSGSAGGPWPSMPSHPVLVFLMAAGTVLCAACSCAAGLPFSGRWCSGSVWPGCAQGGRLVLAAICIGGC